MNTPTCPDCSSTKVSTLRLIERFPYGQGSELVYLSVKLPLRTCADCGFEYYDSDAEDIRSEAIRQHLGVVAFRKMIDMLAKFSGDYEPTFTIKSATDDRVELHLNNAKGFSHAVLRRSHDRVLITNSVTDAVFETGPIHFRKAWITSLAASILERMVKYTL